MEKQIDNYSRFFVVLGISGHGKSSFINAISGKNCCFVSNRGKSETQDFEAIDFPFNHLNFVGVDTPGLQDTHDNNQKINLIKTLLTKYPFIRTILIVKKYDEVRFLPCFQECLEVFMEAFPLPNFWDHVIIVNTRANPTENSFKDFLDDKPPSFLENVLECDNLVKLMKEKIFQSRKRYKNIT